MELSMFSLAMVAGVTLVSSVGFVVITSELSKETVGRPLYWPTKIVWVLIPLTAQAALVVWAFHPISYLIIIGLIAILEWITIRVPKRRPVEKIENPAKRFAGWLIFSIWPLMGMFMSATLQTGSWAFKGKTIILYCLVPIVLAAIGFIRLAICGEIPEKPVVEVEISSAVCGDEDDLGEEFEENLEFEEDPKTTDDNLEAATAS